MKIEELSKLSISEIREEYRKYLKTQRLSPNTIQTSCTDAFYLLRNDSNLDFWGMFRNSDYEHIAFKHLRNALTENSHGNVSANINCYMSHIRRLKKFIDGNIEIGNHSTVYSNTVVPIRHSKKCKMNDIPKPSIVEVEKYLNLWDELENYHLQESSLDKLFFKLCPNNTDISDVLLKASTLNDFYSTNIFSIFPVAKHIVELDIDERLQAGDEKLVDEIKQISINGRQKNFYSFATKYCSHHNPDDYPIYDSYVYKVLCYFRNVDGFSEFQSDNLKHYEKFKTILVQFRSYYGLEKFSLKEIDKYLWQFGKKYFPNKFGR